MEDNRSKNILNCCPCEATGEAVAMLGDDSTKDYRSDAWRVRAPEEVAPNRSSTNFSRSSKEESFSWPVTVGKSLSWRTEEGVRKELSIMRGKNVEIGKRDFYFMYFYYKSINELYMTMNINS